RVRPYAQCQREHGDHCKAWRAPQLANSVTDILQQSAHLDTSRLAQLLRLGALDLPAAQLGSLFISITYVYQDSAHKTGPSNFGTRCSQTNALSRDKKHKGSAFALPFSASLPDLSAMVPVPVALVTTNVAIIASNVPTVLV